MSKQMNHNKVNAHERSIKTRMAEGKYGDKKRQELSKEADRILREAGFLKGKKCY